jgi:hypothetical protein
MYRGRGEETGIYWTSVMANAVINRYAIMVGVLVTRISMYIDKGKKLSQTVKLYVYIKM